MRRYLTCNPVEGYIRGCLCAQEDLVRSYDLPFEVVGSDADARLRILPQGYVSGDKERSLGAEWDSRNSGWHSA